MDWPSSISCFFTFQGREWEMRRLLGWALVKRSNVAVELAMELRVEVWIRPWLSKGTLRYSRCTGTLNGILVSFTTPLIFYTLTLWTPLNAYEVRILFIFVSSWNSLWTIMGISAVAWDERPPSSVKGISTTAPWSAEVFMTRVTRPFFFESFFWNSDPKVESTLTGITLYRILARLSVSLLIT